MGVLQTPRTQGVAAWAIGAAAPVTPEMAYSRARGAAPESLVAGYQPRGGSASPAAASWLGAALAPGSFAAVTTLGLAQVLKCLG